MDAGLTTEPSMPAFMVYVPGTVGAELVSATVRFVDCAVAPKPSFTVRRKNSVALAALKAGETNVALRGVPGTGVRATLPTAHVGAHGFPALSVCTHW